MNRAATASAFRLLLLLFCAAQTTHARETALTVENAWIAEAPPGIGVNAGYLTIYNRGEHERILERVSSPAFGRVEMHRTLVSEDGGSTMRRRRTIPVPAGDALDFSPGGYHLMLFENREPVRRGDNISLTLHFADGTLLKTSATVRRRGDHNHH